MRSRSHLFILPTAFALLFFLQTGEAQAHRMLVFAQVENGQVIVEGAFAKGAPCRGCKIRVTDTKGETVFSGKTDDTGQCRFASPALPQNLEIRMDAGLGHMAKTLLTAKEFTDIKPRPPEARSSDDIGKHPPGSAILETPVEDSFHPLTRAEIEDLVEIEVARRFEEVRKQRNPSRKERLEIRPGEVVGGLGFILGLFALILAARKRAKG